MFNKKSFYSAYNPTTDEPTPLESSEAISQATAYQKHAERNSQETTTTRSSPTEHTSNNNNNNSLVFVEKFKKNWTEAATTS